MLRRPVIIGRHVSRPLPRTTTYHRVIDLLRPPTSTAITNPHNDTGILVSRKLSMHRNLLITAANSGKLLVFRQVERKTDVLASLPGVNLSQCDNFDLTLLPRQLASTPATYLYKSDRLLIHAGHLVTHRPSFYYQANKYYKFLDVSILVGLSWRLPSTSAYHSGIGCAKPRALHFPTNYLKQATQR